MKIVNVMASSIDGRIGLSSNESDEERRSYGFTNIEDREFVRSQILSADAVMTGAKSMRASSGAWLQKNQKDQFPHWYVFSNRGLEPDLEFWRQRDIPRTVVSESLQDKETFADLDVDLIYSKRGLAALDAVKDAEERGFEKVLLFGGGFINKIFYAANLVDELMLTLCPKILGSVQAPYFVSPPIPRPVSLNLVSSHASRSHVFLHYKIQKDA